MECNAVAMTEAALRRQIKENTQGLYVLYGEESYLTEQYAHLIASQTVEEAMEAFNLHRFDGQAVGLEQLEEAVEALPVMADKKAVLVRDMDIGGADSDRLLELITHLPEECVLVFWQMTVQPDRRKGWTNFLKEAEKLGTVMKFTRKTPEDVVKLLVAGAKRRGCVLAPADARYMLEQAGNDLHLLLNELEKLAALATDGVITRESIDIAGTKNLEARVYDLSKVILRGRGQEAFDLLQQLFAQREEPLAVLGALSTAYADLYRARVATAGGQPADSLARFYAGYKNKEFRLRNALREGNRMDISALRQALQVLAAADTGLKSGRGDGRVLLEQAVAQLLQLSRGNR